MKKLLKTIFLNKRDSVVFTTQQTKANQRAGGFTKWWHSQGSSIISCWWPCVHSSPIWTWNLDENAYWSVNPHTMRTHFWLVKNNSWNTTAKHTNREAWSSYKNQTTGAVWGLCTQLSEIPCKIQCKKTTRGKKGLPQSVNHITLTIVYCTVLTENKMAA